MQKKFKIRKDDLVEVIAGKDNGKEGKVISVDQKTGKVLVEGVNMITKHEKPSMANQQGGIIHQEGPIDLSNVMYLHNGKATRVGFKMDGDKKVRVAKATGDKEYILSGRLDIEKVNELFDIELPESDEYQTVGGLILHQHQSFPKTHEIIKFDSFEFKIIKVTATKIELVKLKVNE